MLHSRKLVSVWLASIFVVGMISIPGVHATQEIAGYIPTWAGSCFQTTTNQKACAHITAQLLRDTGEITPNGDFYSLVLRYWDDNNTLTSCAISGKWDAWVTVSSPSAGYWFQAASPQSGFDWSQSSLSFVFGGVTVPILIPGQNRQLDVGTQTIHWGIWSYATCTFDNYAELAFSVSVPESSGLTLSIKVVSDSCTMTGYNCGSSPGDTSQLPTSIYTLSAPAGNVDPPNGYVVPFYSVTGGGGCGRGCYKT